MKNLLRTIFFMLSLMSCSKSDNTIKPDGVSETNLIGKWEDLNAYPTAKGSGRRYYEFKADKTLTITNQYAIGTANAYSMNSYTNVPWSIEGNVLQIQDAGFTTCSFVVLPPTFNSKLICKFIEGSQPCSYVYQGTEKYSELTLAEQ